MIRDPRLRLLLVILAAPTTWFLHVSALYAGATLLCTGRLRDAGFEAFTMIGTVIAFGVLGILLALLFLPPAPHLRAANEPAQFLTITGAALILLAATGIVWTYAPVAILSCNEELRSNSSVWVAA